MLPHFYLEYFDKNQKLIFGLFNTEGVKQSVKIWNVETVTKADFQQTILTHLDDADIMLFIHGYWSKYAYFSRYHQRAFGQVFKDSPTKSNLIELIWQSDTLWYRRSWREAAAKGAQFGHIMYWLSEIYAQRLSLMCHSMGAKFFEGILTHFDTINNPVFDNIILYSVDLDAHVFDTPFRHIADIAQNVTIFYHNDDITLGLAQFFQRKKRLGVVGDRTGNLPDNVSSINMSSVTNTIDRSRHSLFWTSKEVQDLIKNVLQKRQLV
jgi:esterase/lipase superfamily enzyme